MNNRSEKQNTPQQPSEKKIPVSRGMVGIITVGCFVTSLVLLVLYPQEQMLYSGFLRVGLLMGAFWLALPTKTKAAAWAGISPQTVGSIVLAMIALLLKVPIPIIAGVWVIWWVLHFIFKPLSGSTDKKT